MGDPQRGLRPKTGGTTGTSNIQFIHQSKNFTSNPRKPIHFKILCVLFAYEENPAGGERVGSSQQGAWPRPHLGVIGREEHSDGAWTSRVWACFCGDSFLKQELQSVSAHGLEEPGEKWFTFSKDGTLLVERLHNSEMQTLLSSSVLQTGYPQAEFSPLCNSFLPFPVHFTVY